MKYPVLLLCTLVLIASYRTESPKRRGEQSSSSNISPIFVSAIDANLPLYLDSLDFRITSVQFNDGITSEIESIIREFEEECEMPDMTEALSENYIHTIRIHENEHTLFLVLLRHYPTGYVNSKVLFYNNQKKKFIKGCLDFNLSALYHYQEGILKPSNLKSILDITNPEIEVCDINQDGIQDFKFVRLYHNGTANAIHETVINLANNQIDTLSFHMIPIKS